MTPANVMTDKERYMLFIKIILSKQSKIVKNRFIFFVFDCIIKSIIEQSIPKSQNILVIFGDSNVFFTNILYNDIEQSR